MTEIAQRELTDGSNVGEGLRERLAALLEEDLNFHDKASGYASHNYHSFPAKFPPQLPRKFIQALTNPGDVVLDPMMGSGTTVLEAFMAGRQAIGVDIDPLATLIARVKVTPANIVQIYDYGNDVASKAAHVLKNGRPEMEDALQVLWDSTTKKFVDFWFLRETQLELAALAHEIGKVPDRDSKAFLELALSSIIITKSGGVSLALDLGHTRPHRAKRVLGKDGAVLWGENAHGDEQRKEKTTSKTLSSPIEEFRRRVRKNLNGLAEMSQGTLTPVMALGNAENLPIRSESVDLIVTSPPYASNAIDYMRAHKFSLVWLGHGVDDLSRRRARYIGGEVVREHDLVDLPANTARVVEQICGLDRQKGRVLHRYFSEMTRSLREMFRVLKPGKAAVVVVGSSVMRGVNTETASCLADIGKTAGFEVPKIGVRALDRDRRMMPMGNTRDGDSQIQQRMHEEYVIGMFKPALPPRVYSNANR